MTSQIQSIQHRLPGGDREFTSGYSQEVATWNIRQSSDFKLGDAPPHKLANLNTDAGIIALLQEVEDRVNSMLQHAAESRVAPMAFKMRWLNRPSQTDNPDCKYGQIYMVATGLGGETDVPFGVLQTAIENYK